MRGDLTPAPLRRVGPDCEAVCDDCNDEAGDEQAARDFAAYWSSNVPISDAERGALLLNEGRM